MREVLSNGHATPALVRGALTGVSPDERDAWLDAVLGLEAVPADGPELPRGCVPYLPCPVAALLCLVDDAAIGPSDVFVDVGSGAGRTAALVELLTGAAVIGLEIQSALVATSRRLTSRIKGLRFSAIEGDAVRLVGLMHVGSVFFLYCPFSGRRLEKVVDELEPIARARSIRVCAVDVPLPPRSWLSLASSAAGGLEIYRSTLG
jgi:SAM-dependent methyltransferase